MRALAGAALFFCACGAARIAVVAAQQPAQDAGRRGVASVQARAPSESEGLVERASAAVCLERELDPKGSVPIDEMQARPSLPTRHPEVAAGARRAERLLPAARELAAEALRGLMRQHRVAPATQGAALRRLAEVRRVRPDVELRDNASVLYSDPHTIRFGTIFLAGLRSDEGMLSVLAHELVHAADGVRGELSLLFRRVGLRAERARRAGRISARRAEELTCDLVGVLVVRLHIARSWSEEPPARRASRAVAHNCVERDETDSAHLSPRETMRSLFALEPSFAGEVTGEAEVERDAPLNHTAPSRTRPPRAKPPTRPNPRFE